MPAQLKRRLFVVLAVLGLIAAILFAHWLLVGRFLESTDNAYAQGEITRVSSQLGARIEQVLVQDNQHVARGELLVMVTISLIATAYVLPEDAGSASSLFNILRNLGGAIGIAASMLAVLLTRRLPAGTTGSAAH